MYCRDFPWQHAIKFDVRIFCHYRVIELLAFNLQIFFGVT